MNFFQILFVPLCTAIAIIVALRTSRGHIVRRAGVLWTIIWLAGAVLIAVLVTLYFFRQNLIGIHESSGKALKIMVATTIMAVIMITWCLITLVINGAANDVPWRPDEIDLLGEALRSIA